MTRRSRRGLTLMETMVAVVILLIMSGVVFESLRNSITFHNLLSQRDETVRTARAALGKIARDLQLAYLTPNRTALASYQTVFVGVDEDPSKVFFATLNHQRMYLNSRESDQAEITLWAEEAPDDRGRGHVLMHRESPRIDQYPDEEGRIWPLAYNVRTFRLRYLDQVTNEWKTSWDTRSADTPYRLPRAVEIGLVLIAPDPEDPTGESTVDVPFLERVVLEYAERMPNPNQTQVTTTTSGQGGYGGGGWGGYSAGPLTGGTLGLMSGANSGRGGRSAPAAPKAPYDPGQMPPGFNPTPWQQR